MTRQPNRVAGNPRQ